MSRPKGIVALTIHLAKLRWARLGSGTKIALVGAALVGMLGAMSYGSCMLRSVCGAYSSSCPYSASR